jgi:hypothetical protein
MPKHRGKFDHRYWAEAWLYWLRRSSDFDLSMSLINAVPSHNFAHILPERSRHRSLK